LFSNDIKVLQMEFKLWFSKIQLLFVNKVKYVLE
jgi:hypothetical protein